MDDCQLQQEDDSTYQKILKSRHTRLERAFNMIKSLQFLLQGTVQGESKLIRNHPTGETKRIFAGFASTCPQVSTDVLEKAFMIFAHLLDEGMASKL